LHDHASFDDEIDRERELDAVLIDSDVHLATKLQADVRELVAQRFVVRRFQESRPIKPSADLVGARGHSAFARLCVLVSVCAPRTEGRTCR
jgi:hypothetical protein